MIAWNPTTKQMQPLMIESRVAKLLQMDDSQIDNHVLNSVGWATRCSRLPHQTKVPSQEKLPHPNRKRQQRQKKLPHPKRKRQQRQKKLPHPKRKRQQRQKKQWHRKNMHMVIHAPISPILVNTVFENHHHIQQTLLAVIMQPEKAMTSACMFLKLAKMEFLDGLRKLLKIQVHRRKQWAQNLKPRRNTARRAPIYLISGNIPHVSLLHIRPIPQDAKAKRRKEMTS